MPTLTIDGQQIDVAEGTTLLQAARSTGARIPTLCHRDGCAAQTSCLVCVVMVEGRDRFVPSCSTPAADGMVVHSECEEVLQARRTALELLFSDHAGECLAPCQHICPAHMDVPLMIRQIAEGDLHAAVQTVKADIPLAATLGRVCAAPCEKGCRHTSAGGPVAICLLKRFAADTDLASASPWLPHRAPASGKRVAIVGAGPAGLTAAYFLQCAGHDCMVFEGAAAPGGRLRRDVDAGRLDDATLDAEIRIVERLGATIRCGVALGRDLTLDELQHDHDAVLLALGEATRDDVPTNLSMSRHGIAVDPHSYMTNLSAVFAAGAAAHRTSLAVHSVAEGKAAAACIDQFLRGLAPRAPERPFNMRMASLDDDELDHMIGESRELARLAPADGLANGFSPEEAKAEAQRCLACSCDCAGSCALRAAGEAVGANPTRFRGDRRRYETPLTLGSVVLDQGKCIACGLCVEVARDAGVEWGIGFVGRGFNMRLATPFGKDLEVALGSAADACIAACPTGALRRRSGG